jgi:hypothetical protein
MVHFLHGVTRSVGIFLRWDGKKPRFWGIDTIFYKDNYPNGEYRIHVELHQGHCLQTQASCPQK